MTPFNQPNVLSQMLGQNGIILLNIIGPIIFILGIVFYFKNRNKPSSKLVYNFRRAKWLFMVWFGRIFMFGFAFILISWLLAQMAGTMNAQPVVGYLTCVGGIIFGYVFYAIGKRFLKKYPVAQKQESLKTLD